jgi:dihydroorotate dehydrogenase electron transfer subunit
MNHVLRDSGLNLVDATVLSNDRILGPFPRRHLSATYLIRLQCEQLAKKAKPGNFVMIRCGDDLVLPRPLSIHYVENESIFLLYAVLESGKGTNWLSKLQPGAKVQLFGRPLGNPFSFSPDTRNLLLVAGGMGIAPLHFAAYFFREKCSVTLLYGTANDSRYVSRFLSQDITQIPVTEDGSVGRKGSVTDFVPEFVTHSDQIFACGPSAMYRAMAQMPELQGRSVQVSLEMRMACGFGVCYGCTIRTRHGLKQVCKDGPVFELRDIVWDEMTKV